MFVYFKFHLADGSETKHSFDLTKATNPEEFVARIISIIDGRLEAGKGLLMWNPNTYYAPGQVRYVEIAYTEDAKGLEESTGEEFKRKMGFIK